jgi:hypothetical protein
MQRSLVGSENVYKRQVPDGADQGAGNFFGKCRTHGEQRGVGTVGILGWVKRHGSDMHSGWRMKVGEYGLEKE